MVEAAGVEREGACFRNPLMVPNFWANSRSVNHLVIPVVSPHVLSTPLKSTPVMEK